MLRKSLIVVGWAVLALSLGVGIGTLATAQEPTLDPVEMLEARQREIIHDGDPLEISGIGEGEHDFRARTPGLLASESGDPSIEDDDAHALRLALYDRSRMQRFVGAAGFGSGLFEEESEASAGTNEPPAAPSSRSLGWFEWLRLALVIGLCAWLWRSRRPRRRQREKRRRPRLA